MVFMRSFCVVLVRNSFAGVVSHYMFMKIYQNSRKEFCIKSRYCKLYTNYTLKIWNSTISSSFDKFPWGQEACTYKLCCPNNSKSIYIFKIGAEDRFIAETSLSKNSSTGMSTTEMSTVYLSPTEIFSLKISAAECPSLKYPPLKYLPLNVN